MKFSEGQTKLEIHKPSHHPRLRDAIMTKAREMCHGKINSKFVQDSMRHADFFVAAYDETKGRTRSGSSELRVGAFALLNVIKNNNENTILYVNLICSNMNKAGGRMMEYIHQFAKEAHFKSIILRALPHVTGFYTKLGYEKVKPTRGLKTKNISCDTPKLGKETYCDDDTNGCYYIKCLQ